MLLHSNIPSHQGIPKEYNLEVTNMDVHNTFVFAEQDLPSYAAKNKERANALAAGIPAHLLRQKQAAAEQQSGGGSGGDRHGRRSAPYTRKAIPKKTSIKGRIRHEVLCTPSNNPETERFLFSRAAKTQTTEQKVKIFERLPAHGITTGKEWEHFLVRFSLVVFLLPFPILFFTNNSCHNRKHKHPKPNKRKWKTRRPAGQRTSCSTRSPIASLSTSTGPSRPSGRLFPSPRRFCEKLWRRLRSFTARVLLRTIGV